ncbi:MAG: hypothetical protein E7411_05680 [Ruminococcaceae bacterium]|nr:hypothetical protein [Oscillospiraceae bacterium]
MKDRVFIIWSGDNEAAKCVKQILERDYSYICVIGGNNDNSSSYASISDTVIQQMRTCNQAIVIFQNKQNGAVSENLFFELGYSFASYGATKVHCVRRNDDKINLPSDFDNSFVYPITCEDTVEAFAEKIVDYFMIRQKMSVNENKMFLIDNRYMIHEKIVCHYSEMGSQCSDYELAQYILYYMQAAMMFNDIGQIHKEILEFKRKYAYNFSHELELSVNICLSFFKLCLNIKEYRDTHDVYIDEDTFFEAKKSYKHYLKLIKDDDLGIFDEWAKAFVSEHLNYIYMLFGNNLDIAPDIRANAYSSCIKYGKIALEDIEMLRKMKPSKENHDDRGLLALLKSYVTRNMYISKKYLGEEDAIDYLKESIDEREFLKNNYGNGIIDSQIYNIFCMEYYLALISYIDEVGEDELDEFDISMYRKKILAYLSVVEKNNNKTAYLHKLRMWCEE